MQDRDAALLCSDVKSCGGIAEY